MKNKVSVVWMKITAYVIGTLSAIVMAACVCAMVFIYVAGTEKEALNTGYENIAESYLGYILEEYFDNPEEVKETMEDVNLYYTILKEVPQSGGEFDMADESTYIYSNVPEGMEVDYICMKQGMVSETYRYNISHLLGALRGCHSYEGFANLESTDIQKMVLDTTNNLFYFQTEAGYFLADYVYVKEDGKYYDYMLETIEGVRCYYNSYYHRILDTANYRNWTGISCGDSRYTIDPNQTDGIFRAENDVSVIQEGLMSVDYEYEGKTLYYSVSNEPVYMVAAAMMPELDREDLLREWYDKITWLYALEDVVIIYESIALMLFVISLILLICTANGDKEALRITHKCPVLTYLGVVAVVEIGLGSLCVGVFYLLNNSSFNITLSTVVFLLIQIAVVMMIILFGCILNLATRIKTRTLFRYSELYYITRPLIKLKHLLGYVWGQMRSHVSLTWKVVIVTIIIDVVEFIFLCTVSRSYYFDRMVVIFAIYKLIQLAVLLLVVYQMDRLQTGSRRIANGDLSEPIDTSKMLWEFKKHGENINKVGEGISKAVENQLKSERFKTELITNVSHDIKTPLTSIINYVDLIKKENITDPTLCEYVEVLDRQSNRLKKLIEDLMEASKASTGNLKVEVEECDISMLIGQVAGEFEDRFTVNGLETVITKPKEPVYVLADGRHLWRVLDNLMTNIYKYSMPFSRVYIALEQHADKAVIQFKNMSKTQLNISSEELMERFVRGDSSRNTEGSGLGLSIAQSLTELMGGSMKLDIDGDLFKVTLIFDVIEK